MEVPGTERVLSCCSMSRISLPGAAYQSSLSGGTDTRFGMGWWDLGENNCGLGRSGRASAIDRVDRVGGVDKLGFSVFGVLVFSLMLGATHESGHYLGTDTGFRAGE